MFYSSEADALRSLSRRSLVFLDPTLAMVATSLKRHKADLGIITVAVSTPQAADISFYCGDIIETVANGAWRRVHARS
jgi:hypothetical protein